MVRDDPSGTLKAALQEQIDHGHQLAADGTLIGDGREVAGWLARKKEWRSSCAQVLGRSFDQEALDEFLYATARSGETELSQKTIQREVGKIENAIELLISLRNTLGSVAANSRRARARELAGIDEAQSQTGE